MDEHTKLRYAWVIGGAAATIIGLAAMAYNLDNADMMYMFGMFSMMWSYNGADMMTGK